MPSTPQDPSKAERTTTPTNPSQPARASAGGSGDGGDGEKNDADALFLKLSPAAQERFAAFLFFRIRGFTQTEIAEKCAISRDTLKGDFEQVRTKCDVSMREVFLAFGTFTPCPAILACQIRLGLADTSPANNDRERDEAEIDPKA